MAYLIADGLILAVLLLFALVGAHRGFILSLCGLLAVLVALWAPASPPAPSPPWWRMP